MIMQQEIHIEYAIMVEVLLYTETIPELALHGLKDKTLMALIMARIVMEISIQEIITQVPIIILELVNRVMAQVRSGLVIKLAS